MVKKSFTLMYRAAMALLWLGIIVLSICVLGLRYVVFPNIHHYKDDIAKHAALALGQNITIGDIHASWSGLNPHLALHNVQLYDSQNRPALALKDVETSVSWLSIPLLEPRLSQLLIKAPTLIIRRESDGNLFVAGIPMSGPSRPEFANWLLRQGRVDVTNATITWKDEVRQSPELSLTQVHLAIENPALGSLVGRHQIAIRALPSTGTIKPFDIRASLYGKDVSKLETWHGMIYGQLEAVDIAAWHPWVSYPFDLNTGYGAMRFWFNFADGKPMSLTSDLALSGVKTKLSEHSAEANLNKLSGRITWKQFPDGQQLRAERINLDSVDGLKIDQGLLDIRQGILNGKPHIEGDIQLNQFNLMAANRFAHYLPLPESILQKLDALAPTGQLLSLSMQWKGDRERPSEYSIRGNFKNLGLQAYQQIPGFSNITGSIKADDEDGTIQFETQNASLDLKQVLRWPIPVNQLTGEVKWQNSDKLTTIEFDNISIKNAEINGVINGEYQLNGVKGGYIDLKGHFPYANAKTANHYYPTIMGKDTLEWLDTSILAGKIENVDLVLKGNLDEFPFVDKQGEFKVTADLSQGILDYGKGWPRIDDLKVKMIFKGPGLELLASDGRISGSRITKAHGVIPVLDADNPILTIEGETTGQIKDGIAFINHSPVLEITDGFTQDLVTTGNGKLSLWLAIPLNDTDSTKVKGRYQITNGSMSADSIPDLSNINGNLDFTEHALSAKNISTWVFGGPAQFNLSTGKNRLIKIAASGKVTDLGLKQGLKLSLLDQLSGSTDWVGDIAIQQQQLEVSIRSNLVGMASNWPAPLNKLASESMPLKFSTKQQTSAQDIMSINLSNYIAAKFLRVKKNGKLAIDRGQIGLNVSPEMPDRAGVSISATLNNLDGDAWLAALSQTKSSTTQYAKQDSLNLNSIDLSVGTFDIFNRHISSLKLKAKPSDIDVLKMNIQSQEVNGDVAWLNQGNGKITARLKTLIIPQSTSTKPSTDKASRSNVNYPALDIVADNVELGQKKLGSLELQAVEKNENWVIEKLNITNPDSTLNADGEWRSWKKQPNTKLNVNWNISNLGNTLERFGYPNTIKNGTASLQGQFSWPNSPHEFESERLNGNLKLEANDGQILKVQPGVGRLFSLLTLQNLPRRLTFDFKDVFSDGFAFDKISANVKIDQGIMRSDNFKIKGPTALVEMKGQTDLSKETQHLYIKVTPYISDTLSIAALAGGPAVAAATYLAQKLLKDPLNQFARDQYEIVGTWDNPVEVKAEQTKPENNEPKTLGQ